MNIEFNSKCEARAHFSTLRASISKDARAKKSLDICKKIAQLPEFNECDALFLYAPIKSEADPSALFEIAKAHGMRIAFPISVTDTFELDFRFVNSFKELELGAYGIREPRQNAEKAFFTQKSICVVPALSFDSTGNRLGYGKGFYDRFLINFIGLSVGITFDELKCNSLPHENTDISVDIIITDKESVRIK
ncbi:MAG: 5-formyltetrahydrofolate cyclo-ligase [Ruminococcaceae bacterium]|nr:5-formyltetrahydrofolate cyclo-ligase [Oscillospiraceae bacterium]